MEGSPDEISPLIKILSLFRTAMVSRAKAMRFLVTAIALSLASAAFAETVESDICVYGGTSGGVIAAVQAQQMGKRVVLVEFGKHLGGLTSGGLTYTDIGNKGAVGGLSRQFYRALGKVYGKEE